MLHIGCHLSSAKGLCAMGRQALALGADTFQFFTRNPRGSRAKALDAADADAVCTAIRDGLNSKQWMCGFPDKMVIAKVSGCIVSVYGAEDLVNTFRDKLTAAYENAEIVYDEAIAF